MRNSYVGCGTSQRWEPVGAALTGTPDTWYGTVRYGLVWTPDPVHQLVPQHNGPTVGRYDTTGRRE